MAQRKTSKLERNVRVLARRYGISAGKAVAIATAVLLVAVASIGALGLLNGGGMSIERADEAADAAENGSPSGAGQSVGTDGAAAETRAAGGPAEPGESQDGDQAPTPETTRIIVHVDGAVAEPGVYTIENPDARINDAVTHAGGLTPEADTSTVNLAAPVSDGQKVHIPVAGEAPVEVSSGPPGTDDGAGTLLGDSASSNATSSGGGGLVNVNTASEQELCQLPGIGEVTAASIVREREANGPYASVEDVTRVSGIGERRLEKIRDLICV